MYLLIIGPQSYVRHSPPLASFPMCERVKLLNGDPGCFFMPVILLHNQ
jgi:hypothetical protein